jgi:hypothetical protein
MTGRRNWDRTTARERVALSRTEQLSTAAYVRDIEAAPHGARVKPLDKTELRKIAAKAVAEFAGDIRRFPARCQP